MWEGSYEVCLDCVSQSETQVHTTEEELQTDDKNWTLERLDQRMKKMTGMMREKEI